MICFVDCIVLYNYNNEYLIFLGVCCCSGCFFPPSLLGSISEDYILSYIPNNQYASLEANLVTSIISDIVTSAVMYPSLQSNSALIGVFILGEIADITGEYNTVKPYILQRL
jgi:hypothetical protein